MATKFMSTNKKFMSITAKFMSTNHITPSERLTTTDPVINRFPLNFVYKWWNMADMDVEQCVSPERIFLSFSQSLLELLNKIENCNSESDAELNKLRLEQAITSMLQILPILPVGSESSQIIQQFSRNLPISLICRDESHWDSRSCASLAVYSIEPPSSHKSGSVGRPKLEIPEETLLEFRSPGYS